MSTALARGSPARLPFDRYQRYAFAARAIEVLRPGVQRLRLLEVGAHVHRDLERFVAHDEIVYLDLVRATDPSGAPAFVQGDASASPFLDRAVDVVIALDVLEHVPPPRRAAFLAETLRVAARGVVIGAPFRNPEISDAEARLNSYFRDLHGQDFVWLAEHATHGLPDLCEVLGQIQALGWRTAVCTTGNLRLWSKLMQAHLYVNSDPELIELRGDVDAFYNAELADRDGVLPVYRHFIVCAPDAGTLERLAPAVDPARAPDAGDLLRLQVRLDRLYETGERTRARRARESQGERTRLTVAHGEALAARDARIAALEASGRELAEMVANLESRGRERDARLIEILHDQATARPSLATRARGAWRRLCLQLAAAAGGAAAAGHLILTVLRGVGRLWRSRTHTMRLEPLHDLLVEGDGYRSLGDDPQFLLHSPRRRLPGGWVVVAFAVELRGQWLSPKLYVDGGRGFSEDQSFALPLRAGRRVECVLGLPGRVHALRLDPLAARGRFVLRDVTIREIGLAQLIGALLPQVRSMGVQPRSLLRLAGLALATVRRGGIGALTQSWLARDREVADYQDWIDAYDTLTDTDRALIRRHVDQLAARPLISVLMPTYNTPEVWLRRAIESVRRQLYPDWELCIADDASSAPHVRRVLEEYRACDPRITVVYRERRGHISAASNSALGLASGEFVALLDHDDELAERALYLMAVELDEHPRADILYSDEDKLTAHGQRFHPYFKPDWNPDLFLAQNLVTHLCVCRTERVREVGGFRTGYEGAQDWDLVMRIAERVPASHIRHVAQICYHWRAVPGSTALAIGEKGYASAAQYRTLVGHFERRGVRVEIHPVAGLCWRIRYPLPHPVPLVTVIIPTRDRADLLQRCICSLRERTLYPRLELVVVDNQSTDPDTLAYLCALAAQPDVSVVRVDAPFNYSALNNFGARRARGDVLLLLNNDVEAMSPGWLEELVSQACRPDIGAVGAMLYYPNATIQHAGVILGLGTSGIGAHAYAHRPRGYVGQIGRALLTQNVSAVTAACLAVRRPVFEEVGGFDEALTIAYNDLDLCLRIRGRGYRNLWTPHAELVHVESASRGAEDTPAKRERFQHEIEYMRRRWGAQLGADPAYNPNLSLDGESFTLAFPPRTPKPWLDAAELEQLEPVRAERRA